MTATTYKGVTLLTDEETGNFPTWEADVMGKLNRSRHGKYRPSMCVKSLEQPPTSRTITDTEKDDKEELDWSDAKFEAIDIVRTYIGGSLKAALVNFVEPKLLWDEIKRRFSGQTGSHKLMKLDALLSIVQGDDETAIQCTTRFESALLGTESAGMDIKPEIIKPLLVIRGALSRFGPLKQLLIAKGDDLKLSDAIQQLKIADLNEDRDVDYGMFSAPAAAAATGSKWKGRANDQGRYRPRVDEYCPLVGHQFHLLSKCRQHKEDPIAWKKRFDDEQKNRKNHKKKGTFRPRVEENDDNIISDSEYSFTTSSTAIAASTSWISDSAATKNMSYQIDCFHDLKFLSNHRVRLGDNSTLSATGVDRMIVKSPNGKMLLLQDVLLVLDLVINLFSIRKIHSEGNTVLFPSSDRRHVFIQNPEGDDLGRGTLNENGLYEMEFIPSKPQATEPIFDQAHPTIDVWHQRLNHISKRRIKSVSHNELVTGLVIEKPSLSNPNQNTTNICVGCAQGKMKRRAKKRFRIQKATKPYERIHTDLIGPFTAGINGYRYIVTFTDEFSRKVKIYFMRTKTETLSKFKLYKTHVEKQKNANIMELQRDGGGEYTSNEFVRFLDTSGILQNGLAERVGQSICDAGFTLLHHSKLSPKKWPLAVRHAVLIQNKLPSSTLGNRTPDEMDGGGPSDLSFLRTFGCDAMIRIPKGRRRKGGHKAQKAVFLGHKEGLKGYIFETYKSKRMVKTGDAKFLEGDWLPQGIQRINSSLSNFLPQNTPTNGDTHDDTHDDAGDDVDDESDDEDTPRHDIGDESDDDDESDADIPVFDPKAERHEPDDNISSSSSDVGTPESSDDNESNHEVNLPPPRPRRSNIDYNRNYQLHSAVDDVSDEYTPTN